MSDGELRQTMKRLMSIHDEIDEKKFDLKTVYADAKSAGYDKTALGLAIRQIRSREKNETPAAQERSAMVELYVSAFDNAPRTYVHVPAREAAQRQNPSEGEVGSAVRTGAPVSKTEHQPAYLSAERDPQSVKHGPDSMGGAGGESPHLAMGSGQGSVEQPQARNEPGSGSAASGGAGVTVRPETPLRPHCLRRDLCGSYGSKHCFECERAAKAGEDDGEASAIPAFVRKTHQQAMGEQA